MQYREADSGMYAKPTQVVPTYYNPNIPVDSRTLQVPPQQTPGALIPQPLPKPAPTVYERTVGRRIRFALVAGFLFLLFSLPITYKVSSHIWGLFSSVPLGSATVMVPRMVQHPNGYQVQQMVERQSGIGIKAVFLHAAAVTLVMYIVLARGA